MKCLICMALKTMGGGLVCSPFCEYFFGVGPMLVANGSQLGEAIVHALESDLVLAVKLSLPKTYLLEGKVWFMWEEYLTEHKSRFVFAAKGSHEQRILTGSFRTNKVICFNKESGDIPFIQTMGFVPWLRGKSLPMSSTHVVIHSEYKNDLVSVNGLWHKRNGNSLHQLSQNIGVYDLNECSFSWSQARLNQWSK